MLSSKQEQLTVAEQKELEQLESVLRRELRGFVEAGRALMEIRDKKLYRATHSSFDAYCCERWALHKTAIYQKIKGVEVIDQLSAIAEGEELPNEWQTRPLAPLEPEQRTAAWQAATTLAEGKPNNTEQVKRAVKAVKAEALPEFKIGQEVTVIDPASPFCGEVARISRISGLVIFCDCSGVEQPFFANEISSKLEPAKLQAQTPPNWTARRDKVDRMQGLEAELQIYKMRCTALEGVLSRVVHAARAGKLTNALVSEAERLLS